MIVDACIKIVVALLTGIFGLLPAFSFADSLWSAGANLGGSLSTVNGVIPVATLGEALGLVMGTRAFMFVWDVVVFIYDRIPFKAS